MNMAEKKFVETVKVLVIENWHKIDLEQVEIGGGLDTFLAELDADIDAAIWVVEEVFNWGLKEPLGFEYCVGNLYPDESNDGELVYRLKDSLFTIVGEEVKEVIEEVIQVTAYRVCEIKE